MKEMPQSSLVAEVTAVMSIRGSRCAWCDVWLSEPAGSPEGDLDVSHGICSDCVGDLLDLPVTDVYDLAAREVDCLAFGLIEIDAAGIVRRYNAVESRLSGLDPAEVVGKNFFTEVAPCTRETEFERRWNRLLARGQGREDFTFVFRFRTGHRIVQIRAVLESGRNTLVLVQPER